MNVMEEYIKVIERRTNLANTAANLEFYDLAITDYKDIINDLVTMIKLLKGE